VQCKNDPICYGLLTDYRNQILQILQVDIPLPFLLDLGVASHGVSISKYPGMVTASNCKGVGKYWKLVMFVTSMRKILMFVRNVGESLMFVSLCIYLTFYVPLKNCSLILRRNHCRGTVGKFRSIRAFEQGGIFIVPYLL
jgi:hypothetical protein